MSGKRAIRMTIWLTAALLAAVTLAVTTSLATAGPNPGASQAAGSALSWGSPFTVDRLGGHALDTVACPSTTECVAVDSVGQFVRFNPQVPTQHRKGLLDPTGVPAGISCPSSTECVATYFDGNEFTFNPVSGTHLSGVLVDKAVEASDGSAAFAIDCPQASLCVAVDGSGNIVTFDPTNASATISTTAALSGVEGGLGSVSCYDSGTTCTAIGWTQEITFNPASPTATPHTVVSNDILSAVRCLSDTECAAVDANGGEIEFSPTAPAVQTKTTIDSKGFNSEVGFDCESTTACTYVAEDAREVTYDPQTGHVARSAIVDPSYASGAACPSTSSCTVVDTEGSVLRFNPVNPGTPRRTKVDPGSPAATLSCPAADECLASAGDQASAATPDNIFRFNPRKRTASRSHPFFRDSGIFLAALQCPTRRLCSAVVGDGEVALNPFRFRQVPNRPRGRDIDPNSDEGIAGLSCPTARECVEVDANGWSVSYRPGRFAFIRRHIVIEDGESQVNVDCPTARECVSVDNDGMMTSFQPITGRRIRSRKIDNPVGLDAPSGDSDNELDAISCPSRTLCVAIDTLGDIVHFNPLARHGSTLQRSDKGNALTGIACPTTSFCVAVDSAGRAVTGNPRAGNWTISTVAGASGLTSVACPSKTECVAVDTAGQAVVGRRP